MLCFQTEKRLAAGLCMDPLREFECSADHLAAPRQGEEEVGNGRKGREGRRKKRKTEGKEKGREKFCCPQGHLGSAIVGVLVCGHICM